MLPDSNTSCPPPPSRRPGCRNDGGLRNISNQNACLANSPHRDGAWGRSYRLRWEQNSHNKEINTGKATEPQNQGHVPEAANLPGPGCSSALQCSAPRVPVSLAPALGRLLPSNAQANQVGLFPQRRPELRNNRSQRSRGSLLPSASPTHQQTSGAAVTWGCYKQLLREPHGLYLFIFKCLY